MTYGAEIWGPPLIAAGASYLSNLGKGDNETKTQKKQRKLVDQLLDSLDGNGPFSDLYQNDENAFQKSFIDPALNKFQNQIAPQIQQQFIASGQQRGTGLDDQLLRAGVDLDSLLNQHMMEFYQGAQNRKQNSLNSILGLGSGAPNQPSAKQDIFSGVAGSLTTDKFGENFANYFKPEQNQNQMQNTAPGQLPPRKGFAPDYSDYNQYGGPY